MADDLTERIIGAAIEVHQVLGPGLLESIHEEALAHELEWQELSCQKQVAVEIRHKGKTIAGQRIDLLVAGEVVVEIKSVRLLPEIAVAQTSSYLKATGPKRALPINFGTSKLVAGVKGISL